MAKYIFQLRRGIKDDATGRDDWKNYETQTDRIIPLEGELVLEYDNGIPRLKIGNGKDDFSKLPYISVDSFIFDKIATKTVTVALSPDDWTESKDEDGNEIPNSWCQVVLQGSELITANSKVDLQPSTKQLAIFHEKDLAFVAENEDGVVTVFCVGQKPTSDYSIQATVTEVLING